MKNMLSVILVLMTVGSLAYGYYQRSQLAEVAAELEAANARALQAEEQAYVQTLIATEQRKAAEMAVEHARTAMVKAEEAAANCLKRKK
jgi:membrane protein required for beta-lactamase induction